MRGSLPLTFAILTLLFPPLFAISLRQSDIQMMPKRDIKPDWEDLGWAWGKRSKQEIQIPRRLLRALHPIKKNPDWHDLGWTWGRK